MTVNTQVEPIANRFDDSLKPISFIQANALFRENAREYQSNLIRFEKLICQNSGEVEQRIEVARRLCQLSREIIFSVDGRHLPSSIKQAISDLYRLSVQLMDRYLTSDGLDDIQKEELVSYRNNISKRAAGDNPWKTLEQAMSSDSGVFEGV